MENKIKVRRMDWEEYLIEAFFIMIEVLFER
jgi:hypothetical protein